jgi:HAD superfamily hydrolase (TIGR01509 family)
MSRAPVLLLDVMDTIVKDPFYDRVPAFFGLTLEELFAAKDRAVWVAFEEGRLDEDEYHRRAFHDGRAYDRAAFLREMVDGYRFLDGMEELLSELKERGVEMHAFSNYPAWYRLLDEALDLRRFLAWSFVSCEMGVRKPDAAAFERALARTGRAPAEHLFVDDREKNCEGARAVGMRAHRFTDARALREALREHGVVP